jgi:disulfide bond formation protein DsbB
MDPSTHRDTAPPAPLARASAAAGLEAGGESTSTRRTLTALAWIVLALTLGPIGTAAFVLGFVHGESPCILCWAQRTGMALIALTGLFIVRYGPRPRYVGFAVLLAAYGVYMALRHSALHLARDIGQGFSAEILGAHTNTWSLFIYWAAAIVMGVLLMTLRDGQLTRRVRPLGTFERIVGWVFLVAVAGNALQAFASTGPPPFVGQSDPVRFSFDPAHWVWSLEEYAPVPLGLRGRFLVPRPDTTHVDPDPARGPFAAPVLLGPAVALGHLRDLDGPVSGLAYDAARDRFVVATDHGITLFDGTLSRRLGHVVVDPDFSVDLARFGDVALLEDGQILAISENKSYVVLREDSTADAVASWRYFLVPGPFAEVARGRFATVRAKMAFVRSAAYDPGSRSIVTVSLPNPRSPRIVVSRFDRRDMTLSQELLPSIGDNGPVLAAGRTTDALYVTAATVHGGHLWALSAAHSTLVSIDPGSGRIQAAYALRGIPLPAGLGVRGDRFVIAGEDGRVVSVPLPTRGDVR